MESAWLLNGALITISALLATISGLIIWIWRRHETQQDNTEKVLFQKLDVVHEKLDGMGVRITEGMHDLDRRVAVIEATCKAKNDVLIAKERKA